VSRVRYDPVALIRALDIHKASGLIRDWRYNETARWRRGGLERPFFVFVDLAGGESYYELRNEREVSIFVHALASAHHAQQQQEQEQETGT
jgi:hypothetical protein